MKKLLSTLVIILLTLTSCVDKPGHRQMLVKNIIKHSPTESVILVLENNTIEYREKVSPKWFSIQNIKVGKKYHEKLFSFDASVYEEYVEFELVKIEDNLTGDGGKKVSVGYFTPRSSRFLRLELEKIVFDGKITNPNNGEKMNIGESCLFQGVRGNGYSPVYNISMEEYLSLLGANTNGSI